ncbi:MAG: DUF2510 domain-containing protein [Microthrixaceae bacterium]
MSVEAGWYQDPYGQPVSRWWDGQQWTEYTQDPGAAPRPTGGGGDATAWVAPEVELPLLPAIGQTIEERRAQLAERDRERRLDEMLVTAVQSNVIPPVSSPGAEPVNDDVVSVVDLTHAKPPSKQSSLFSDASPAAKAMIIAGGVVLFVAALLVVLSVLG